MRADPEPHDQAALAATQGAVLLVHPHGPDVGEQRFEMQSGIEGVLLPGQTNTSLVLSNVGVARAGGHDVVVTNAFGAITNGVVTLSLVGPPVMDGLAEFAPLLLTPGTHAMAIDVSDGIATESCTFEVTVLRDTEPPAIAAPPAVVVNTDPGSCSVSSVALGTPVVSDDCGVASVVNNAPAVFSKGETLVTWTVTDSSGNQSTAVQTVTVVDSEIPGIIAPTDVRVVSDAGSCVATGVSLGWPATSDNCGVASVANDAPSVFPVGKTMVTWTARDATGNESTASQIVTVLRSVTASLLPPLNVQPVGNKIRRGQVVPHKVALLDCAGCPVVTGVTVKLTVQGIDAVTGEVFQDVIEDANGVGTDGTATSDGIMGFTDGHFQFNLDTSNFEDPNTLASPARLYRSTVTVVDNATLLELGTVAVDLETRR